MNVSAIDDEASQASTAPTAIGDVYGLVDTFRIHDNSRDLQRTWKCLKAKAENPDDTWQPTAAPVATGAIKFAINTPGLLIAQPSCIVNHSMIVEFRGIDA